jgi:outer membrane protein
VRTPALTSSFQFKLTQHLLQGFGFGVNTRFIRIAKNNRELSDVAFRQQIASTVGLIENMYWTLVYAYENVKVQKQHLSLAQEMLANNKVQVEIGSLAPIAVARAESTIATDQQFLTAALTNLELAQLLMKNAIRIELKMSCGRSAAGQLLKTIGLLRKCVIAGFSRWTGYSRSLVLPTTWCVCGT